VSDTQYDPKVSRAFTWRAADIIERVPWRCAYCAALVAYDDLEVHSDWHHRVVVFRNGREDFMEETK